MRICWISPGRGQLSVMKCARKNYGVMLWKGVGVKWNESGFRPPLCTYRLHWARRTSWGWWDDWDDTVLQTQDSKFEPWRSEAEHATSRSRRLPTILTFTRGWGRSIFVSFKPPRPGTEPRTLAWKAAVLTTTLGPPPRRRCTRSNIYIYILNYPFNKPSFFQLIFNGQKQKFLFCPKIKCMFLWKALLFRDEKVKNDKILFYMFTVIMICFFFILYTVWFLEGFVPQW